MLRKLVPMVLALVVLSSCGDSARPSAPANIAGLGDETAHLIEGADLPRVGSSAWTDMTTEPENFMAIGPCHKTALAEIGALTAVRRTWASATGGRAVQVVARFADNKSAQRAQTVLESWQADCQTRAGAAEIGPLRKIPTKVGQGETYRIVYRDGTRAGALGILRKADYLSVIEISARTKDFPADGAPTRAAVQLIAATF